MIDADWEPGGPPRFRRREFRRRFWMRRLAFHLITYVIVMAVLVGINALMGGRWWSLWIAGVWGGFLLLRFVVGALVWQMLGPGPRRRRYRDVW